MVGPIRCFRRAQQGFVGICRVLYRFIEIHGAVYGFLGIRFYMDL